jgi:hypothetical protein
MSDRPLPLAVGRIEVSYARRIGPAPRAIIACVGPELADLGTPAAGIDTGAVVSSANSLVEVFKVASRRSCTGRSKQAARPTQSANVERSSMMPCRA